MKFLFSMFRFVLSLLSWIIAGIFALLVFASDISTGLGVGLTLLFGWLGMKIWPNTNAEADFNEEKSPLITNQYVIKESQQINTSHRVAATKWVSSNQKIEIGSFVIQGGLIYVGEDASNKTWRSTINPKFEIADKNPDLLGEHMYYYPSYSYMNPHSRLAFLQWLVSGRRSEIEIGYVFVFFYGLERRLFYDLAYTEAAIILGEVKQLLEVYGSNRSFQNYAQNFILFFDGLKCSDNKFSPVLSEIDMPPSHYDFPLVIKIQLGKKLQETDIFDASWMFVWHANHPETRFRIPAQRAFKLYKIMFLLRFREKYGEGLKIKIPKSKLSVQYRAASGDFSSDFDFDLPDISTLTAPWRAADKIAEQCQEELARYSRYIGKFPNDSLLPKAIALLPVDIAIRITVPEVKKLREWIDNELEGNFASIPANKILAKLHLDSVIGKRLTKSTLHKIANIMQKNGYGIEPGPETSSARPELDEPIIIFRLPKDERASFSEAFIFMSLSVLLSTSLASADGIIDEKERQALQDMVIQNPGLTELEKCHLEAQSMWFLQAPQSTTKLKKLLQELSSVQKQSLANQAVAMAVVDGQVDKTEMAFLEKVFGYLDLPQSEVYSRVLLAQGKSAHVSNDGLTRLKAEDRPSEYLISKRPSSKLTPNSVDLDLAQISALRTETSVVSTLLAGIFDNPDETEHDQSDTKDEDPEEQSLGLDKKHVALLIDLTSQPEWDAVKFEKLCQNYEIMPAGAMETFNEWSFDKYDDAILEEDDKISLNPEIVKQFNGDSIYGG